jgi:hypothetical protein
LLGKFASLKPVLMILAAAAGSITASGSIAPYLAAVTHSRGSNGNFLLTANPSSISVAQGSFSLSAITVTSINGLSGGVTLSTNATGNFLQASFSTAVVTVSAGGQGTSTLNVTAASGAPLGDYTVVVMGTSSQSHRILSSSTVIIVHVGTWAGFSITAQPYSFTLIAGQSASTSILLASQNGFSGSVSLTATVPFGYIGVMAGANSIVLSSGGTNSTTLQISTSGSTLPGMYGITVTGTAGGNTHSCVIMLDVLDPVAEYLVMTGYTFNSNTSLTLYIKNNGTRPVTLTSYVVKDFAGDAWVMSNWAGPVLAPGSITGVNVAIGSSCPTCTYVWVIGLFPQFIMEQTYTVVLTTLATNQFSFNVRY